MAYIITNYGEQRILSGGFMASAPGAMTASLIYSANTFSSTMGGFLSSITNVTAGRAGNGICSTTLNTTGWGFVTNSVSAGSATISATAIGLLFAFTAAPVTTAIGYAIWDSAGVFLIETFSDGPYYLNNAGDTVLVTPYVKLGSGTFN
jgi:hypothetical protein